MGCSLNSTQEASLNNAVLSYVDSHNAGAVMKFVSIIHPKVVQYYEGEGDEAFKQKFELFSQMEGGAYIQDGTVWEIETKGKSIHARYTFLSIEDNYENFGSAEIEVIAISEDQGVTWFFVDREDYKNNAIFNDDFRLLELKE
ncbi:MAG: hypothetical protein ACI865_001500 [Flavobacteriaceae bacterium]|jgi:hypothetical protein